MKGNNANGDIRVFITIDNNGSLITDTGEQHKIARPWKELKNFTLPGNTQNVTIKAHNDLNNVGGIVASFKCSAFNIVTDESWKCKDVSSCNKPNSCAGYALEEAKTYGPVNASNKAWHANVKEITRSAQWIWVSNRSATSVWCQKTFGE